MISSGRSERSKGVEHGWSRTTAASFFWTTSIVKYSPSSINLSNEFRHALQDFAHCLTVGRDRAEQYRRCIRRALQERNSKADEWNISYVPYEADVERCRAEAGLDSSVPQGPVR